MFKSKGWILLLAAMAAALSLMSATASLAIALVAAAAPPVSQYLSAEQNADVAARMKSQWVLPLLMVAFALLTATQVFLRRPFLISVATLERYPVTRSRVYVTAFATTCVGFFWVRSLISGFDAIRAAATAPITDSLAFSGLGSGLGTASLMPVIWSLLLYQLWWQGTRSSETMGVGDGTVGSSLHVEGVV